mmetsp:Transcript_86179/g.248866  ORF Transcript_86179/g.248866 Transcript_86179/m.248866 type:complete len:248 (-) Transcript_86179:302-1045(-)
MRSLVKNLILAASTIGFTSAFTICGHPGQGHGLSSNSRLDALPKASLVSVCTAELCCCQEDGVGGNEILADLQSRDLPYTVDEAPCPGACGGGAMVAIDFEDGTSALVSGLDETLSELGLSEPVQPSTKSSGATNGAGEKPEEEGIQTMQKISTKDVSSEKLEVKAEIVPPVAVVEKEEVESVNTSLAASTKTTKQKETVQKPSVELVDVRERMRAEAAQKEQQANPWLNAASYLAGKAADKIFGGK